MNSSFFFFFFVNKKRYTKITFTVRRKQRQQHVTPNALLGSWRVRQYFRNGKRPDTAVFVDGPNRQMYFCLKFKLKEKNPETRINYRRFVTRRVNHH